MLDFIRAFFSYDGDDVETDRCIQVEFPYVGIGCGNNPSEFLFVDALFRLSELFVASCLHFDDNQFVLKFSYNVQFLSAGTPVEVAYSVALLLQKADSFSFSFLP